MVKPYFQTWDSKQQSSSSELKVRSDLYMTSDKIKYQAITVLSILDIVKLFMKSEWIHNPLLVVPVDYQIFRFMNDDYGFWLLP